MEPFIAEKIVMLPQKIETRDPINEDVVRVNLIFFLVFHHQKQDYGMRSEMARPI